ncbi:MAG: hypothetical protein ACRDMV_10910 [Streptosporangiales bacterium]
MLTQPGTHVAWDHPSPSVVKLTEDEDASGQATTYLLTSRGESDDDGTQHPLCSRADNPDLLDGGMPALWRVNSSDHSSVTEQATLDGYARSYAAAFHDPVVLRTPTVRADDPIHPIGSYRAGDTMQLSVHGDPWIADGSTVQRITDIAPSGLTVALTVSETA